MEDNNGFGWLMLFFASLGVVIIMFVNSNKPPSPKFKIGDCVNVYAKTKKESWEKNKSFIIKIENIGNDNYQVSYCESKTCILNTWNFILFDTSSKVDCPKEYK